MAWVFVAASRAVLLEIDPARNPFAIAVYGMAQIGSATIGGPLMGWLAGRSAADALHTGAAACVCGAALVAFGARVAPPVPTLAPTPRARALAALVERVADAGVPGVIVCASRPDCPPESAALVLALAEAESRKLPDAPAGIVRAFYARAPDGLAELVRRFNAQHGRDLVALSSDPTGKRLLDFLRAYDGPVKLVVLAGGFVTRAMAQLLPRLAPGGIVAFEDLCVVAPDTPATRVGREQRYWFQSYFAERALEVELQPLLADQPGAYVVATDTVLAIIHQRDQRRLREQVWSQVVSDALVSVHLDPDGLYGDWGVPIGDIIPVAQAADARLTQTDVQDAVSTLVGQRRCLVTDHPRFYVPADREVASYIATHRAAEPPAAAQPSQTPRRWLFRVLTRLQRPWGRDHGR